MTEIEDDVLKVLAIYGRAGQKATETDLIVWFNGERSPSDIRQALRTLEDDRRVIATSETYWSIVK